jgi:hypothetical protein
MQASDNITEMCTSYIEVFPRGGRAICDHVSDFASIHDSYRTFLHLWYKTLDMVSPPPPPPTEMLIA